ncbi:hypothetical protein NDU88_001796 [Pleurodeles waltl]|uniref:Uncharacterized protein n=1 Tax=Pleurodeles waltl TaxID=8319 RepID=A0AAV7WPR8_PLEWA|nr:hypothetical protein NDU88_001796 [Pleurodeles waltl]
MEKITAARRTKAETNSEEVAVAEGTAGAGQRKLFPVTNKGDPKTTSSTKDATEDQEAVCLNSGHAQGRAWPLQTLRTGREEKGKKYGKIRGNERKQTQSENSQKGKTTGKAKNKQKRGKRRTN